jgi:uncharacterized protein involved in tolerance to divalent cations
MNNRVQADVDETRSNITPAYLTQRMLAYFSIIFQRISAYIWTQTIVLTAEHQ